MLDEISKDRMLVCDLPGFMEIICNGTNRCVVSPVNLIEYVANCSEQNDDENQI